MYALDSKKEIIHDIFYYVFRQNTEIHRNVLGQRESGVKFGLKNTLSQV